MTIKQQGGIFGRNPTFNDVDANTLDVDGSITATGLTVDGDIATTGGSTNNRGLLLSHQNNINASYISRSENGAADTGNRLMFDFDNDSFQVNTGGATRLDISNTGNVNVKTGNLVIGTSGQGIDFSATSGAGTSELFDDYEEGTWTPTYLASTTNPTFSSYVFQTGYYTKIGQMVYVSARMRTNGYNSDGAGNLRIGGLPFTSATVATIGSGGSVNIAGSYLFSTAPVAGYFLTGGSYIQLNSNLSFTVSTVSALSTATSANDISFFGVYRAS